MAAKEIRTFSKIENRSVNEETNTMTIDGYALVWDVEYPIMGGPERGGFLESVKRGAAKKTLQEKDDIRLLINHDGVPIARSKSGTLSLQEDEIGLRATADLDLSNPKVQELRSAMDRGDIDNMSFAFNTTRDEWTDGYTKRSLRELKISDVSIVTYPASEATLVGTRSAFDKAKESRSTPVLDELRSLVESIKK